VGSQKSLSPESSMLNYAKLVLLNLLSSWTDDYMNEWIYLNPHEVAHVSGFRLELFAGTWSNPEALNPITVKAHSAIVTAGLIREGLKFAKHQNAPHSPQVA